MLPAVILAGGEGTRLRPLTDRAPKPMLPLLGRPLLAYALDHLAAAGVTRTILACGYLPTAFEEYFGHDYGGMTIEYRVEPEPLGTGGAIRFAAEGLVETFFALNGDSLREADLVELVTRHRATGARATILLTPVADVSRYGVVRTDVDGRVLEFVEKPPPGTVDTNLVNAGLYVLEPSVLDLVAPGAQVSIERVVFPELAARGELFAFDLPGYWLDVGTPESLLQAHLDLLARAEGPVIDAGAVVAAGATIGKLVYVGAGARVGEGARLERAAVLPGAMVGDGESIEGALVAPGVGVL
jgi:NDP-sugar pyrophosphorylase family protein